MKRKVVVLVILMILNSLLFAGTAIWEDGFDENQGWTFESNWSITDSQLRFYWSPQVDNYDLSAISSEITLPENVGDLQITHSLDDYSGDNEVVEISVIVNEENHILWNYEISNGDIINQVLSFSLNEFGGETVKLKFRSYGNSTYNINSWGIFDAKIFAMLENDLSLFSFNGPSYLNVNNEGIWEIEVKNIGIENQENFSVNLCSSNSGIISVYENVEALNSGETLLLDMNYTPENPEINSIYAEVILENDDYDENNISDYSYLYVGDLLNLNVFVWNNDNGSDYYDFIAGQELDCEKGIETTLDNHGISYDTAVALPEDLSSYNIIFGALGLYCLG